MSLLPVFTLASVPLAAGIGQRSPEVLVVASRPADPDGRSGDRVRLDPLARAAAADIGIELEVRLVRAKATAAAAEVVELQIDPSESGVERMLVAGLGGGAARDYRRAGAALARRTRVVGQVVVEATHRADAERVRAFVEGWGMAAYAFSRKSAAPPRAAGRIELLVSSRSDDLEEALRRALVTVEAVHLARDLANTPSNEKSPGWLARRAEKAAVDSGLSVTVRDSSRLGAEGFGGLLAVGSGSAHPPCLIEMRYAPSGANSSTPHVVLVGKGITFDTGGLSLKPSDGMVAMKTDMSGGGAVIAVMCALTDLAVPIKVTGLVAAAENMPSGSAYRPGDVIEQFGGTTVEVFNTDAEGRLVLADALAYTDRCLAADAVVDVATLTGAATLGLGRRHAAMFATDDGLAAALERAADRSGERVWRMPLVEDYRDALDSDIADLAHISRDPKVQGGAITAALFLREFVGEVPWVHLDIAGPGRADGDEHEITRGATGYGTRLLLRWLESSRTGVKRRR